MLKEMLARGIRVSKDRVCKLMQQQGIKVRTKGKILVDHLQQTQPTGGARSGAASPGPRGVNRPWSGDTTRISIDEGWLYLAAVINLKLA